VLGGYFILLIASSGFGPCLPSQGKNIVFRFIIESSSLSDFDPEVVGLFLYEDFEIWHFGFC